MRKKWGYIFIVFVIVIVVLYVGRYKQTQVFENRVPANVSKVVNVNLRQIENHLLFDLLSNPITYLKPRKRKDSIKKPSTSLTKGLSIPRNILFYTNSDELKNNWFSSIVEVNDKEKLSRFLLNEKFAKITDNNTVFYNKANLVLAIRNEELIIALKVNKTADIRLLLNSLFDVKDYLSERSTILNKLIRSKSDIGFSSSDDSLEANFNKGVFELQGIISSDLFITNSNQKSNEKGVVAISGRINKNNTYFREFLSDKKVKINEITHLSLDSIVNKWNGKFNMNIASVEHKIDTIVSYEYDDDFNKVEIKSTQEKRIPTLGLLLGQEDISSLSDYFYSKNAIQIIKGDTLFTAVPIYKFLAIDAKENFELHVNRKVNSSTSKLTKSKLNFYFNTEKYIEKPFEIPLKAEQEKFLKLTKTTNLVWAADNQFSLEIVLKDKSRNFLGQLIKQ